MKLRCSAAETGRKRGARCLVNATAARVAAHAVLSVSLPCNVVAAGKLSMPAGCACCELSVSHLRYKAWERLAV